MRYAILLTVALPLTLLIVVLPLGCTRTPPPEPVHDGKTLSEWLNHLRNDRDVSRDDQIVQALAKIGKPAVPALIVVLEDLHLASTTPDVNVRAARALGETGPDAKAAIPALTRIVKERAASVLSRFSARALARIERPDYSTLILALKDKDEAVRGEAAGALHVEAQLKQDMKAAVPALIVGLEDRSSGVRRSVAAGLWYIGADAKPAVPALVKALNDKDEDVRTQAREALKKIDRSAAKDIGIE